MSSPSAALIASELSEHPGVDALGAHVHRVLLGAATARDLGRLAALPDEDHPLEPEQAETEQGNVLEILERGPTEPREAALLAALLVRGIAREPPSSAEGWRELAVQLAWLAARTPVSAFDALDSVLRDRAGELWRALGTVAEAPEKAACGRAEALVAAAALARARLPRPEKRPPRSAARARILWSKRPAAAANHHPKRDSRASSGQYPRARWPRRCSA